jgi:histidinol-phosphate/aromatic aminotransferase/cobyric acid decarboxylase-like protein
VYPKDLDLRLGFAVTTTEVINAEDEDDHPRPVAAATAATAAASLADRAGEEEWAMLLDRERWMSSKWGKWGI